MDRGIWYLFGFVYTWGWFVTWFCQCGCNLTNFLSCWKFWFPGKAGRVPLVKIKFSFKKNCMDFGKKRQLLLFASRWPKYGELRDGKNFFNLFSPSAFGLVVPRESKNFVSFGQLSFGRVKNFCPSGVLTHPLRTKFFHSPSGQLA